MAIWDGFIGLGFLIKCLLVTKSLRILKKIMPHVFVWTMVTEVFYFLSFTVELVTFLHARKISHIRMVRYTLDVL